MKKILALVAVFIFASAVGAWAMDLGNGITATNVSRDDGTILMAKGPSVGEASSVEGMSAGGLRVDKPVENGITYFSTVAPASHETAEAPAPDVSNGITAF
jgi:hypothetical protein